MTYLKPALLAALVLCILGALGLWWRHQGLHPSTDDAYVQARITTIASVIGGQITQLPIDNDQHVEAGDVLVRLDPTSAQARVDAAQAQLAQAIQNTAVAEANIASAQAQLEAAQATLRDAQIEYDRNQRLLADNRISQSAFDRLQTSRDNARASVHEAEAALRAAQATLGGLDDNGDTAAVRAARANLAEANYALSHTEITAPASGWIVNLSRRPGDVVAQGQPLFSLIEDSEWWLDANFKETDIERIRPGQPVRVSVDMYPGVQFRGRVSTIGRGSGAVFALLPPQNASGNWVHVTQRFPIRIDLDDPLADPEHPLRVGASAKAVVDTRTLETTEG